MAPPGMLSHLVLHELAKSPCSGYSLCKQIGISTGHKPSFGSIYPLLERLEKDGIVSVRQHGRRKVYTLTAKGKQRVIALEQQRGTLVTELQVHIKTLMQLTGEDPKPILFFLERVRRGEAPVGPVSASMFSLRDTVFRMVEDGRAQRHSKEINAMLAQTRRALEKLA